MFRSNEINVQNSIDPFYIEMPERIFVLGQLSGQFMALN